MTGQRLEPDRAALACRVCQRSNPPGARGSRGIDRVVNDDEADQWCRRCGCEGTARDTVTRALAHEPLGWRPTMLLVSMVATSAAAAATCGVKGALV